MVKSKFRRRLHKISKDKMAIITAVIVLVVVAVGLGLYYHNRRPQPHTVTTKTTVSSPSNTQSVASKGDNNKAPTGSSQQSAPATSPSTITTSSPPQKPSGYFVSNHYPGQNGSSQDERSVCNTTPGASCYITFNKDEVTKSLPAATTDSTGAAYWSWTPNTVGLTSGNWMVSATATIGQQSVTTQDPTQLEVQ